MGGVVPVIKILKGRANCFGYQGQVFAEDEDEAEGGDKAEAGVEEDHEEGEEGGLSVPEDSVLGEDLDDGKLS